MKKSSLLLFVLAGLLLVSILVSNLILKHKYDQLDKSDPFWNYVKLEKGSFHHIRLKGGNGTRIAYIPGPNGSVGILNFWEQELRKRVHADIQNDTLYVEVKEQPDNPGIRNWMKYHVLVAISSPELLSVDGVNTNFNLYKLQQKNFSVQLAGKSSMEVESYISDFDSINVRQQDSSQLKFERSEDLPGSETLRARILDAEVQGFSLLDVGHFQLQSIRQAVGDSSGIILSGGTLKTMGYRQ